MNLTAIEAYIALLRRDRSLTQRELANWLGVSCQAMSKWERGENLPDAGMLLPLAEALHTTADALLSAGVHRPRRPVDLSALQAGLSALSAGIAAIGEDSPIGKTLTDTLHSMGHSLVTAEGRERLLVQGILCTRGRHRCRQGPPGSHSSAV